MAKRLTKAETEKYVVVDKNGIFLFRFPAFDLTNNYSTVDVEFPVHNIQYILEDYTHEASKHFLVNGSQGSTSIVFFYPQVFKNLNSEYSEKILVNVPCKTVKSLFAHVKRKDKKAGESIFPCPPIEESVEEEKDPPSRWDLLDL